MIQEQRRKSGDKDNMHGLTHEEIVLKAERDTARKEFERGSDLHRRFELLSGQGKAWLDSHPDLRVSDLSPFLTHSPSER